MRQTNEALALRREKAKLHREMSKLVVARDGFYCVLCGATDTLEVHEVKPRSAFGRKNWRECFVLENMVTLCRACHAQAASLTFREKLLQYLSERKES